MKAQLYFVEGKAFTGHDGKPVSYTRFGLLLPTANDGTERKKGYDSFLFTTKAEHYEKISSLVGSTVNVELTFVPNNEGLYKRKVSKINDFAL